MKKSPDSWRGKALDGRAMTQARRWLSLIRPASDEPGPDRVGSKRRTTHGNVVMRLNVQLTAGLAPGKCGLARMDIREHDDLVIALALACWRARRRENHFGEGRLPGF
ncbi:MAG TPA: hypothetical protein VHZ74_15980 [Bryobacteraceae bacterium]|nr:hypothetical protein [Bryobacteraceae bacterium]